MVLVLIIEPSQKLLCVPITRREVGDYSMRKPIS